MKLRSYETNVGFVGFLGGDRAAAPERSGCRTPVNSSMARHEADTFAATDADVAQEAANLETRASRHRNIEPDSQAPLVPAHIRAKIEAVESDARAKGWPAELLWNGGFWDCPRGLAVVLDADDEIVEVTAEHIAILKTKRDLLRFRRNAA